jgi:hypothetical protein
VYTTRSEYINPVSGLVEESRQRKSHFPSSSYFACFRPIDRLTTREPAAPPLVSRSRLPTPNANADRNTHTHTHSLSPRYLALRVLGTRPRVSATNKPRIHSARSSRPGSLQWCTAPHGEVNLWSTRESGGAEDPDRFVVGICRIQSAASFVS